MAVTDPLQALVSLQAAIRKGMATQAAEKLVFSVQVDESRILELLVDQVFSGDCVWQVTNASGQVLERSEIYQDQAYCLRDGLNKALR